MILLANVVARVIAALVLICTIVVVQPVGHALAADVSSGTSSNLDQYRALYDYSLPPGKSPADIVGMGIAGSNDHVYVWFDDGTVSSGTSSNLDQYRALYGYSLPPGKSTCDIAGMGIAGSNDRVYAWFE